MFLSIILSKLEENWERFSVQIESKLNWECFWEEGKKINYSIERVSPGEVKLDLAVPAGSSMTKWTLKYILLSLNGFIALTTAITLFSLFKKSTSIGKRIKKVCTELQGLMIRAWRSGRLFFPNKPRIRLKGPSAITTVSASRVFLLWLVIFILIKRVPSFSERKRGHSWLIRSPKI